MAPDARRSKTPSSSLKANRFKTIGRSGEVAIPPDATVVDVSGKTVLPGFIDGHAHLEEFHGELYLNLGITTCCANRDLSGRSVEPRAKGGHQPRQNSRAAHLDERHRHRRRARNARCVRFAHVARFSRRHLGGGNARASSAARRSGATTASRSTSICRSSWRRRPATRLIATTWRSRRTAWDAFESARAGVDAIEHIWSVGYSSIPYPPARRKLAEDRLSGKIEQELAGAYYQTENFDRVIDAMVGSKAWRGRRPSPNGCGRCRRAPIGSASASAKSSTIRKQICPTRARRHRQRL